jgi:hypothetical protein
MMDIMVMSYDKRMGTENWIRGMIDGYRF